MKYTDEELIESLHRFYKEHDRPPSSKDLGTKNNMPSLTAYTSNFGSWSKVTEITNIYNKKEILLEKLKNFANKLGRTPTKKEVTSHPEMPSATTYRNNFGSWNNALESAGLRLYRQTLKTDKELLEALYTLYIKKGTYIIQEDVDHSNLTPSASCYISRFGSWSSALAKAKVPEYCKAPSVSEENLALSYNKDWLQEQNKTKSLTTISKELGFKSHGVISSRFKELGIEVNNSYKVSSQETELLNEIQKFYTGEVLTSQRILKGKELDIYFPEENLGIEFNGLYWHSERQGKDSNYHLNKTKAASSLGIRLIHIFENEWANQKSLVLSRIKNLLGKSKRIYARKCNIKELEVRDAKDFLNKNHIQKYTGASVKVGLYYQEELVAVMTFGKSRYSGGADWELIRYANKAGTSVVGGASKLFKYFLRNYNPEGIISYSDKRWNTGKLYSNLGFEHTHDSKPNYWYFKGLEVYSRVKFQKHKLPNVLEEFEPKWTEVANMEYNGWNRIFDCGNAVFLWTR